MQSTEIRTASRNIQLDFFRGLALMIIFVNHIPANPWFHYTPSRFGPSDAAEIFVFLSGFVAAIAFGRCFQQAGIMLGSVRVLYRCGQIYLAHLILFLLLAVICVVGNRLLPETDYIQRLNIQYFFENTQDAVLSLVSLRYVPNFIDILPMYMMIMLWVPAVWVLSRIHVSLALAFPVLIYLTALRYGWELPADPLTERHWYFNPFTWQLVFFTGFALSAGWLPTPKYGRKFALLCIAFVLFCLPLEHEPSYRHLPFFAELRNTLATLLDKSHLGIIRWLHFLALAYLASNLTKTRPNWLRMPVARWITTMGQQALPMFMLCSCLSFAGGILLDWTGRDEVHTALVNLAGLGAMLLAAQFLSWLDRKPWKTIAEDEKPLSINWGVRALPACGLALLTIFPVLLLQREKTAPPLITASNAEMAIALELPLNTGKMQADEAVYHPPEADNIEPSPVFNQ